MLLFSDIIIGLGYLFETARTVGAAHFFFTLTSGSKVLNDGIGHIFQPLEIHFERFEFSGFFDLRGKRKID